MRVARAIATLTARRDYLTERMVQVGEAHRAYHGMRQEQKAIEAALPILEEELARRHATVMEQREVHEAKGARQ